jgi:hypothetical protein
MIDVNQLTPIKYDKFNQLTFMKTLFGKTNINNGSTNCTLRVQSSINQF